MIQKIARRSRFSLASIQLQASLFMIILFRVTDDENSWSGKTSFHIMEIQNLAISIDLNIIRTIL